jgi:hypothetical protein
MSPPANIKVFNQIVAKVFVLLHDAFPTPTNIDPLIVGMDIVLEEKYESESAEHKHLVTAAEATVQFLIDENFIRVAAGPQYLEVRGFQNVVLTSKGFSLLQKTPESINSNVDRRSYFERFRSYTASGAKVVATEAIGPVVAHFLGAG